jgi:hypothetical protein
LDTAESILLIISIFLSLLCIICLMVMLAFIVLNTPDRRRSQGTARGPAARGHGSGTAYGSQVEVYSSAPMGFDTGSVDCGSTGSVDCGSVDCGTTGCD